MAENLDLENWEYWCNILSLNSNVFVSSIKWDDLIKALTGLKLCAKNKEYRSRTTKAFMQQCRNVIENSCELDFNKCCEIQTEAFRLLRNCCVCSKKNQDYAMSCGLFCTINEILEQVLQHYNNSDMDCVKQVVSSGIQFLGNIVVDHDKNQEMVWTRCYPDFFMKVMKFHCNKAKNFICMVIYNCIKNKSRSELCITCEGTALINDIIKMCCTNEIDVEWGIFIIEALIKSGSFQHMYSGVNESSHRLFLLELIEHKLKGNHKSENCLGWISLDNALFISRTFEDNISKILNSETNFDVQESSCEVVLVSSLLRLLCLLTAFPEQYQELRARNCLLETTLVALRETSREENKKFFSDLSQISNPSDRNLTHPAFGFKRNLIQLIGNMCYHNTMNQDCVRQMNCIPLLLDHCNIDDYNPYICQWAIFCIRNVLEDNQENQRVIKSLTKLGLAQNTRLAEAGFFVEETPEGKLTIVGKQSSQTAP